MNRLFSSLAALTLCTILWPYAYAADKQSEQLDATVYYFDFAIHRMAGIPEKEMESYGCVYKGNFEVLNGLVETAPLSDEPYEPNDVRAKVIGAQGKAFFIDSHGISMRGSESVKIDRALFARKITRDTKFSCPRMR